MNNLKRNVIFYVDDDPDDLDIFQDVIGTLGKSATLFENGADLLKTLKDPPAENSIIFLDLNMPVMSGFEVLEAIRKGLKLQTIPIVVLSTGSDLFSIETSRSLGADFYICKPSSPKEMYNAIAYALQADFSSEVKPFVYCDGLLQH